MKTFFTLLAVTALAAGTQLEAAYYDDDALYSTAQMEDDRGVALPDGGTELAQLTGDNNYRDTFIPARQSNEPGHVKTIHCDDSGEDGSYRVCPTGTREGCHHEAICEK